MAGRVHRITFFKRRPFGKPPGRCIYCGASGGKKGLCDEHIVAYCLASNVYFPKSSCSTCEDHTKYIEGYVGRVIFGPMRSHFQIQSRKRSKGKARPVRIRFLRINGTSEIRHFDSSTFPAMFTLPIFRIPGIFQDRAASVLEVAEYWTWSAELDLPQYIRKFFRPDEFAYQLIFDLKPIVFARMLAKIAHAFATASLGADAFVPYLPPIILGRDDKAAYLIGGAELPTEPGPAQEYRDDTLHHKMSLELFCSAGRPDLIAMSIRLFLHTGSPTYRVIVGQALPPAIIQLTDQNAVLIE